MTMQNAPDNPSVSIQKPPDYLGTPAQPFAIGLKPLGSQSFLQIDEDLLPYRAQKQEYYQTIHNQICMAETDSLDGQIEVEELVARCLKSSFGALYHGEGSQFVCRQTGETFSSNPAMPISSAALLVPEDLILMRRDETGWRLVAASLSFPASWTLAEKFSRPLEAVHGPVPLSTQMGQRINRIFDALQTTIPVWRTNWSLDDDGQLRQPRPEFEKRKKGLKDSSNVYFRTEFQTLHKLPKTQDILFTVRTKSRPITSLLNDPNGKRKLALLHQQYLAMNDAERNYKGINHNADGLLKWLEENGTC